MKINKLMYETTFKTVFYEEPDILLKMLCDIIDFQMDDCQYVVNYGKFPSKKSYNSPNCIDLVVEYNVNMCFCLSIDYDRRIITIYPNGIQVLRSCNRLMNYKPPYKLIDKLPFIIVGVDNFNNYDEPVHRTRTKTVSINDDGMPEVGFERYPFTVDANIKKSLKLIQKAHDVTRLDKEVRWVGILNSNHTDDIKELLGQDLLTKEQQTRFINRICQVNMDEEIMSDLRVEMGIEYWQLHRNISDEEKNAPFSFVNTANLQENIPDAIINVNIKSS